jgi:zinc protease
MLRRTAVASAVGLVAALAAVSAQQTPGGAQGPPSTAGLVKKGKAPVSTEVLKVKLPKPQEADLPNGLHLMVLEDHRLPRITFQVIMPGAGGYYDPENQIGLASYTAQMMREGTTTKTSQQLSQALETIAAGLTVGTGVSSTSASMSGSALTEHFDRLFDMAADVLLNPSFPAEEWDRLKTRAKAGLQQQRAQPSFLAAEMFNRVVYGQHPASRISATPQSIDAISRDSLVEFHRTHYVPDHAAIAFAGDISLADARRRIEATLAGWKKAETPKPATSEPPAPPAPKVYLISRPNSVQTTLLLGMQSMTRIDPDFEELTVANRVLGGVMGRLFRHLREEKGYTYGIGSGLDTGLYR